MKRRALQRVFRLFAGPAGAGMAWPMRDAAGRLALGHAPAHALADQGESRLAEHQREGYALI